MRATYNLSARKRPVNLTLNEDLVTQALSVTDNLSGVVESLLAENETIAAWNSFAEEHGSFADEYSTL